ncbi:hypothetical protein DFJ73DRAFT_759909 [Zopfochytrium polystomum]|nr:hypothetical protein DFJ73DRAFT_759909 [Zopfochytrium polystomum]
MGGGASPPVCLQRGRKSIRGAVDRGLAKGRVAVRCGCHCRVQAGDGTLVAGGMLGWLERLFSMTCCWLDPQHLQATMMNKLKGFSSRSSSPASRTSKLTERLFPHTQTKVDTPKSPYATPPPEAEPMSPVSVEANVAAQAPPPLDDATSESTQSSTDSTRPTPKKDLGFNTPTILKLELASPKVNWEECVEFPTAPLFSRARKDAEKNIIKCKCEEENPYSPTLPDMCDRHSPDGGQFRAQTDWRISMQYEQTITCYNVGTEEFVSVRVFNGFRDYEGHILVAISHLWPERTIGPKAHRPSEGEGVHPQPEMYKFGEQDLTTAKEKTFVRDRIKESLAGARALFGSEENKVLIWLDVISVNQDDKLAVRDSTYSMSIVHHIADLTLVLIHDERWAKRRWTLQELALSHYISYYNIMKGTISMPEKNKPEQYTLRRALYRCGERESDYLQDLVYAVRGMVPSLFKIPAVYDVDADELIARAAMVAAEEGDFSMIGVDEPTSDVKESGIYSPPLEKDKDIVGEKKVHLDKDYPGNKLVRRIADADDRGRPMCPVRPEAYMGKVGMIMQCHSYVELDEHTLSELAKMQNDSLEEVDKLNKLLEKVKSFKLINCNNGALKSLNHLEVSLSAIKRKGFVHNWTNTVSRFRTDFLDAFGLGQAAHEMFDNLVDCTYELPGSHPAYYYTQECYRGKDEEKQHEVEEILGVQNKDAKLFGIRDSVTWGEVIMREIWLVRQIKQCVRLNNSGTLFVMASEHADGGIVVRKLMDIPKDNKGTETKATVECTVATCVNKGLKDCKFHCNRVVLDNRCNQEGCPRKGRLICEKHAYTEVIAFCDGAPFPPSACLVKAVKKGLKATPRGILPHCEPLKTTNLLDVSYAWSPIGLTFEQVMETLVKLGAGKKKSRVYG